MHAAFLKPGFRYDVIFNTTDDWSAIQRGVRWYTARLAIAAALLLGLLFIAASTLLAFIPS